MGRPPFRVGPKPSEEEIAKAAMQDIRANVTGAADHWKDYDEKYALDRILRAVRETKGQ
jgi:hypothetical protein